MRAVEQHRDIMVAFDGNGLVSGKDIGLSGRNRVKPRQGNARIAQRPGDRVAVMRRDPHLFAVG